MNAWYCIRTMRKAELSLAAELRAIGLTAYVPCEIHDRKVRGRKVRVERPAIPGVAFVECGPERHDDVLACEGAWKFVCYQHDLERPAKMAKGALMDLFLADLFGELDYTRQQAAYRPARRDVVAIKSGMWRGKIARIINVGKRKSLLQPLDGFGRWEVQNEVLELVA